MKIEYAKRISKSVTPRQENFAKMEYRIVSRFVKR